MSTKTYLKAAKQALQDNNPEYCCSLAENALELDPDCYFALIFIGKSNHLMGKLREAKEAYERAIRLKPDDLTAWKGLLLLVKTDDDYKTFFRVISDYLDVLSEQQHSIAETVGEISKYLDKFPSEDVIDEYKRQLLPDGRLQQATKGLLVKPEKALRDYLGHVRTRENRLLSSAKMKASGGAYDATTWNIYKNSNVPDLYVQLINIVDDDEDRRDLEDKYLSYKLQMLKAAPPGAKLAISNDIKAIVEGMVVVNHSSFQAWSIYFDWLDPEDFDSLDPAVVTNFLKKFSGKPLGQVIHGLVLSDMCSLKVELKEQTTDEVSPEDDLENELVEKETFSQEELLALMLQGLESCKNSLFAYRIVISYQDHCNLYMDALYKCQQALSLLVQTTTSTGMLFKNTKRDLLVKYGNVLTHNEPPKHHKRANEIFDKVLQDFPGNTQARVGKSVILIERGELQEAKRILQEVVDEQDDTEALSELSWVEILLGNHEKGREGLKNALKDIKGNSLYILDQKALINWRLAKSYEMTGDFEKSYAQLVDSLRSASNYAPSFSALGEIYLNHFEDYQRATKCFLKAFEIDTSEVKAAWYLVKDLTSKGNWNRAEIYCHQIISSESARRRLGFDSWPYRVLGCSALEKQDEAKAVEWFQNAIRLQNSDTESWVGLGEAYISSGRLEAAIKVFQRALELDPDHWVAQYLMGMVQGQISDFDNSVETLENVLLQRPDEECIIAALQDSLIKYSQKCVSTGFFGKAVGVALKCLDYLERGNLSSVNFWGILNDFIQLFLQIQSKISEYPYERVFTMLKKANIDIDDELVASYIENDKQIELAALSLIYCNRACLALEPRARTVRSAVYYNMGLSLLVSYLITKNVQYRDESIITLKESIKLQNNYQEPWIALGVASVSINPRVAQHCLIKASSIDSKNVVIWSNLALLYLRYEDSSLASETYKRGQSLNPTAPISWLGQAFTLKQQGDHDMASHLFTHSFILANGRNPTAQIAYGYNICMKRIGKGDEVKDVDAVLELSSACHGMVQYLKHYPLDTFGLELTCLILERLSDYELGKELCVNLLTQLETSFEETEDDTILKSFTRVKAQYARFELGLSNYQESIASCLECLDLGDDDKTVVSCRTVMGLCHFFLDEFDDALDQFKQVLTLSEDAKRLVVLIAQVLFVYDTEETKQAALDQLFNNIEEHGSSLLVTLVIGAISIVEDLTDYLTIVKSELASLPLSELMNDRFRNVPYLISQINRRQGEADLGVWQRFAVLFPDDLRVWDHLDKSTALKIAIRGKVTSQELSNCYAEAGNLKDIQRSLFIAPWNCESVKALKGCF